MAHEPILTYAGALGSVDSYLSQRTAAVMVTTARNIAASSDRKAERHAESDFSKRLVVYLRSSQADVEGDVVANLPDRADER